MLKPVKFTRDSGCLARDEFLVISEGDHMLRYIFIIFLLLSTVLYFHFICRPMLVHRMTLVSFRLLRENLGNLREFFGQMVHRPPGKKNAGTPMSINILSLCLVCFCQSYSLPVDQPFPTRGL